MQIKTTRDGTKYNWIVSGEKAGPPQGQCGAGGTGTLGRQSLAGMGNSVAPKSKLQPPCEAPALL